MSNSMSKSFIDFIYLFNLFRLENREIYSASSSSIARSKSPNIFNRKALDSNTSAVNKINAAPKQPQQQQQQQQRARTASMPGENRKVKFNLNKIVWFHPKKIPRGNFLLINFFLK